MGLDMYLTAEKYLSDYSEADKPLKEAVNDLKLPSAIKGKVNRIRAEVGYWRKANAIHDWFVKNCQEGRDECQSTWLSRQQLADLVQVCMEVLADKSKARELLPTAEGFFFGGTDYDDWYFETLRDTIDMIEPLLTDEYADWDFHYQSSW